MATSAPMTKIKRPKPVSELVLERLRDDIIRNRFELGEKISEASLSEAYGVTKAPIRAAYIRLEMEGLITIRAQAGTFVFQPTLEELRALCELRTALETEALRLGFQRDRDGLTRSATEIVAEMEEALADDDLERYQSLDNRLHTGLFDFAQSPLLAETYKARVAGPFAALRTRFGAKRVHNENSIMEHRAILNALQAGDEDQVLNLMRDHINIAEAYYTGVMTG